FSLGVYTNLVYHTTAQSFSFHPQSQLSVVRRECFVVIRSVTGSVRIIGSTVCRYNFEPVATVDVLGTLKKKVLKEVSETGSSRILFLGVYVIHLARSLSRGSVILVKNHMKSY